MIWLSVIAPPVPMLAADASHVSRCCWRRRGNPERTYGAAEAAGGIPVKRAATRPTIDTRSSRGIGRGMGLRRIPSGQGGFQFRKENMMPVLDVGDEAPDFTLPRSGGGTLSLHDLRGRDVILYFYPKDDTSGCTRQACALRDAHDTLEGAGAVVLGVSPDSVSSHDRFAEKYNLPFAL